MLPLIDSLVSGPAAAAQQDSKPWNMLLAVPFLILACCIATAAVAGLLHFFPSLRATLPEDAAFAALAACIGAALALPAIASGRKLPWLLPLWLGPSVGAAGWAVLPLPHGPVTRLAETIGLTLPVMVMYLAASWCRLPRGLVSAAAACGASPFRAMLHAGLRPALPILVRGLVLMFVLALGLAPLLPNTLVLAPMASNP